jgi:glutamine---fructose-6-phosphate transaminase (isomerizing)
MCGVVGYIGREKAGKVVIDSLKKLEYRGYDSAGIGLIKNSKLKVFKQKGKISQLLRHLDDKSIKSNLCIGHTRWATHGKPSKNNAHPHTDNKKTIALVHNGIIENFLSLKKRLTAKGYKFVSDTDTEVIVHLISSLYKGCLEKAVRKAVKQLKGSYALCVISSREPDKIIAARFDSPLALGLGDKENFVISDTSAVLDYTDKVIYLNDGEIASVYRDKVEIRDSKGSLLKRGSKRVSYGKEEAEKSGFSHFMLKEIHQQPEVIKRILGLYLNAKGRISFGKAGTCPESFLKNLDNIVIVACGTAYYSGLVAKYFIESLVRIKVEVDLGSEFRYRDPIISKKSLVIAVSQSGETADTIAAVRQARKKKARVLAICNVLGSSLTRESDWVIHTCAGPEISVASTKAYTAQLTILYLLGLKLAGLNKKATQETLKAYLSELKKIPAKQKKILTSKKAVKSLAKKHLHFGAFLYLARNINFPTALEGALKLKEISYIPAEGYPAGEMKHGPIALIDEYRAVVCIVTDSEVLDKMLSNIQEILARKGKVIIISTKKRDQLKSYTKMVLSIPKVKEYFSPLLTVVPLQLFAYYTAVLKGFDVDKPRNLAKSVTVE